jgi:hypothetical protein
VSGAKRFEWEGLGVIDGGLPIHLPMGVDQEGRGPIEPGQPYRYVCWCGQSCPLGEALELAWKAGRIVGQESS